MQASPETTVYRYIYAPDGLLARIDSSIAEQSTGWTVYHYDAAGSVESIHSEPGCGRDIARCESFTYYPNGQPHTVERYADTFWSTTDTYDERGRLVAHRAGRLRHDAQQHPLLRRGGPRDAHLGEGGRELQLPRDGHHLRL
ncbi:MAG: hypothetical protein ACJ8AT_29890 [Hyalangium sp.]|uniref:hypothetical protein n=1 Tax=Hyalangium sp. TaxID=2028555 RepID=UPI003899E641